MHAVRGCLQLFGGFELLIVRGDDWVRAACELRGHVEGRTHWRAATGDCLAASQRSAIAIDGSDAGEACDLAPIEAPEFRQFGDQGAHSGFGHSMHAGEKVGFGLPGGAFPDRAVDVAIELRKLGLQEIDMPIDGLENAKLASQATAVLFCKDPLDDLTTTRHHGVDPLWWTGWGLGGLG